MLCSFDFQPAFNIAITSGISGSSFVLSVILAAKTCFLLKVAVPSIYLSSNAASASSTTWFSSSFTLPSFGA